MSVSITAIAPSGVTESTLKEIAIMTLLQHVKTVVLPIDSEPINLREFFRDRPTLCVLNHDSFCAQFDLSQLAFAPPCPYVAFVLKERARHRKIREELPQEHLSTLEGIATLIEPQNHGEEGILSKVGMNMFYVRGKNGEVFGVYVFWHSDWRKFHVGHCSLVEDNDKMLVGNQVLCPGNVSP